jgi:hypothetical protein
MYSSELGETRIVTDAVTRRVSSRTDASRVLDCFSSLLLRLDHAWQTHVLPHTDHNLRIRTVSSAHALEFRSFANNLLSW